MLAAFRSPSVQKYPTMSLSEPNYLAYEAGDALAESDVAS